MGTVIESSELKIILLSEAKETCNNKVKNRKENDKK